MFRLLTFLALLCLDCVLSAKILLMPLPMASHVNPMTTLGDALIGAGHDVWLLLPNLYGQIANVKAGSKVKVIDYPIKAWEWNAAMHAGKVDTEMDYFDYITQTSYLSDMKAKGSGYHLICKALMTSKVLERNMKQGLAIDLAVVDSHAFARCHYAMAYKQDIPYISYMQEYDPWLFRSPAVPSYVPSVIAEDLTDKMTFWQRIVNVWTMVYWSTFTSFPTLTDDYITTFVAEKTPVAMDDLIKQSKFWLTDTNFLLDYSRPVTSNELLISLSLMREAAPLTKALHAAVSNITKDGIIVVSLDQAIPIPTRVLSMLIKTFKIFSTYTIFWQYSGDLPDENLPHNVKGMSYLPLNDLLGHASAKLLITSGDNLDQNMALYHGVPVLVLPLDGHQRYNAKRTEYRGYGTVLSPQALSVKLLHTTIKRLVMPNNSSQSIREASLIMRTNQGTARKSLIDWVDIALKSNLSTLQPYALEMSWPRYFMLDIGIFVGILVGNLAFLGCNTCMLCYQRLRNLKQAKNLHKEIVMNVQRVVSQNQATVTVAAAGVNPGKNLKQH